MKIEVFDNVYGEYIEAIFGQDKFYNSLSSMESYYDIPDWIKEHGYYHGDVIRFYDMYENKTYTPFAKKINITYSYAKYKEGYFYFLRVDFNKYTIELIKYYPEKVLESIVKLPLKDMNLYNLGLEDGYEIHICSSDINFVSYYPKNFELKLTPHQSVIYIDEDEIYVNEWVEEGVVEDQLTNDYKYYDKLVVLDYEGNVISERKGSLSKYPNGKWYLS